MFNRNNLTASRYMLVVVEYHKGIPVVLLFGITEGKWISSPLAVMTMP